MKRWLAVALVVFTISYNTSFSQSYQYFFGNIHAHSSYSDGNKDSGTNGCKLPGDSYTFARQSYNFNFLGISEHNHREAGMKLPDYRKGLYQADTANKNGEFVAMYGMEFGVISNGGHVLIYGIDSLIGWEANNYDIYSAKYDYRSLWRIIASKPNAFATLAHPETSDYNNLSTSPYYDTADIAISGTALRSGGAFSQTTDYSDPLPSTLYTGYFRRMLAAGYKLGPTIDHDNHYTTFGRTAQTRTVVLAQSLERDSIMAAYKSMRFYASDDWNTKVNFTVNAYPMGSTITTSVNPTINISVTDPDSNDTVSSVRLFYGIPGSLSLSTVLASVTNNSTLSYIHNIQPGSSYYYYAEITQADGHRMWTSPIWVTKEHSVLPLNNITLKASQRQDRIELTTTLLKSGYAKVELEKSFTGSDFKVIDRAVDVRASNLLFYDKTPAYGYQYYRIKCTENSGAVSYSPVVFINYSDNRLTVAKIFPNPVASAATINIESTVNSKADFKIYNSDGRVVKEFQEQLTQGKNRIVKDLAELSAGNYFIVINAGITKIQTSFIKN